jgi:futalosine hydrolase
VRITGQLCNLTIEILLFLIAAATDMEMRAFTEALPDSIPYEALVTGVGLVETAYVLTSRLARSVESLQGIIHFGIAGSYLYSDGSSAEMLDICLADEEILGDLGICHQNRIEPFVAPELGIKDHFLLDRQLLNMTIVFLKQHNIICKKGRFITVNSASGTRERGKMLVEQFQGLCENMEGAAVARVCAAFGQPCLELRCISNFVEDRDSGRWELKKACQRVGKVTAMVAEHLHENY